MDSQLLTIISTLGGAVIGSGITVIGIILNNHLSTKQEKAKIKRALLDELCNLCVQTEKLFFEAIDGTYPIHEFSFKQLEDIKSRMLAIIIMDFEETIYDTYKEYVAVVYTLQISIENFHSLYVANPSLDDPAVKSEREQNMKLYMDVLMKAVTLVKKIKKASEKL